MRLPFAAVLILLVFGAAEASGCQCGEWPTVTEARERAVAVFEGVLTAKKPVLASYHGRWFVMEKWTFSVERSWKRASNEIVVTEGYSNCSLIYSLEQRAIVYAYEHQFRPNELESSKCRTPRVQLAEQLRQLGMPAQTFDVSRFARERGAARVARHSLVYALFGASLVRNAIFEAWSDPVSPIAAAVATPCGFLALLLVGFVGSARHRAKFAVALVVAGLLVVVLVVGISVANLRGGYFAHLVEYECPSCPAANQRFSVRRVLIRGATGLNRKLVGADVSRPSK